MSKPVTEGYAWFDHGTKMLLADPDDPISQEHQSLFELFSNTALESAFPCIAAQKVIRDFRVAFSLSPDRVGLNLENRKNTTDGNAPRFVFFFHRLACVRG